MLETYTEDLDAIRKSRETKTKSILLKTFPGELHRRVKTLSAMSSVGLEDIITLAVQQFMDTTVAAEANKLMRGIQKGTSE
jgi:hypothetical protein